MRSKRRRRRRRRSRRAGQNKNNPLEKAWDGKGYSNTTHPKAFARDLPIKLGPLARRRGMNNDNRVALTLNPRSRRTKDLSNLAYYNTTRKERKAREKKSGGNRRRRRRRRSRRRRRQSGGAPTCKKCGSDLQCPRCDGGGGNGGSGAAANESRIKENEARIKENEAYIKKKDKEIEDLIAGSAAELEDF